MDAPRDHGQVFTTPVELEELYLFLSPEAMRAAAPTRYQRVVFLFARQVKQVLVFFVAVSQNSSSLTFAPQRAGAA